MGCFFPTDDCWYLVVRDMHSLNLCLDSYRWIWHPACFSIASYTDTLCSCAKYSHMWLVSWVVYAISLGPNGCTRLKAKTTRHILPLFFHQFSQCLWQIQCSSIRETSEQKYSRAVNDFWHARDFPVSLKRQKRRLESPPACKVWGWCIAEVWEPSQLLPALGYFDLNCMRPHVAIHTVSQH